MAELLLALAVVTRYDDLGHTASGIHTSQIDKPWLAVPHEKIGIEYEWNDLVILHGIDENGNPWYYDGYVLDTGLLSEHCVIQDGECLPILFDIPTQHAPFDTLSAQVTEVYNVSAKARAWRSQ